MSILKASSGFNGVDLFRNTRSQKLQIFIPSSQTVERLLFDDVVNDFLAGGYYWELPIPHPSNDLRRNGSPTVALTKFETTEYLFRDTDNRDVELGLTGGLNFSEAQADASKTIIARAARAADLKPGVARLESRFNGSTGFSNIVLSVKGQTPVYGSLSLRRIIDNLGNSLREEDRREFGPYRVPIDGFAKKVSPSRSIASSSAVPRGTIEDGEITAINEVSVTAVDFGLPPVSIARFNI